MKFNLTGLVDNAQHAAGVLVGLLVCRPFGLRFGKEHRGTHKLFSHVAANLAADGVIVWFPYAVIA